MTDVRPTDLELEEQRKLIDALAGSVSRLCHAVIRRRLGQFFEVIGEEFDKERAVPEDISQLMKFYSVDSIVELARIQAQHVERLQKKLPPMRDEQPGYVPREG